VRVSKTLEVQQLCDTTSTPAASQSDAKPDGGESGESAQQTTTDQKPAVEKEEPDLVTTQSFGDGRIFAVGDAVQLDGAPIPKAIYWAEEMACVAACNISAKEGIGASWETERELQMSPNLVCCSLGPHDGLFTIGDNLVTTGPPAAVQKAVIEQTKMSSLRDEPLGRLIWELVH